MPTTAPPPHKVNRADYDVLEAAVNANATAVGTAQTAATAAGAAAAAAQTSANTAQAEVNALEIVVANTAAAAPAPVSALLTATLANTTVTPAVLTNHTFTIPPGRTLQLTGILVATAAATTTGIAYGIRIAQPAGASGPAQGAWFGSVNLSDAAAATTLNDGDAINIAANTNGLGELLAPSSTAGNQAATITANIKNQAAAHSTTVTLEFRSEVASSAVTAQIGTSAAGLLL